MAATKSARPSQVILKAAARHETEGPRGEAKIDLALQMALESSPALGRLLAMNLGWDSSSLSVAPTVIANHTHGAGDSAGESDLCIELHRVGTVLCENKYSADFQKRQGRRYQQRIEELRRRTRSPATCIISAPQGYLDSKAHHPEMAAFEHRIPVEQWIVWIESLPNEASALAEPLRLMREVAADWASDAFQGVKGTWPTTYARLGGKLAARRDGWYVQASAGDWVHIHHRDCAGAKFHYRNRHRAVSMQLTTKGAVLSVAAQADARGLNLHINGKGNVVVKRLMLSAEIVADQPSDRDLEEITRGLEFLRRWVTRFGDGRAP